MPSERRMMGSMDLNYILMAPTREEMLTRITAWNKICEKEEQMQKNKFKKWQVALGIIGFLMILGTVGKIDQDSKQAIIDEKTAIRDALQAKSQIDDETIRIFFENRSR
jgi:hypothetical protein